MNSYEMAKISDRIRSIDTLRGFVILLMLVDHVREFFFLHKQVSDPMSIDVIDSSMFFTRFASHFCAPIFVFLAGISACLYASSRRRKGEVDDTSSYLIKRGLLLVLLEFIVVNFAWFGQFPPKIWYLQVIWVTGGAMIALGVLRKLPMRYLFIIGLVIVVGHNSVSGKVLEVDHSFYSIWTVLFQRGFLPPPFSEFKISYPLLPWIGIIILGYICGSMYHDNVMPAERKRIFLRIGTILAFVLFFLRYFNIYGENQPWHVYDNFFKSAMAFLNFQKYPPSLHFALITLSVCFFFLVFLENVENSITKYFAVFGSVPLFFYILHLYVLLALKMMLIQLFGKDFYRQLHMDFVWQIWCCALFLMFPLHYMCKKFKLMRSLVRLRFLGAKPWFQSDVDRTMRN